MKKKSSYIYLPKKSQWPRKGWSCAASRRDTASSRSEEMPSPQSWPFLSGRCIWCMFKRNICSKQCDLSVLFSVLKNSAYCILLTSLVVETNAAHFLLVWHKGMAKDRSVRPQQTLINSHSQYIFLKFHWTFSKAWRGNFFITDIKPFLSWRFF